MSGWLWPTAAVPHVHRICLWKCETFDANGSLPASLRTHTIGQLRPFVVAAESSGKPPFIPKADHCHCHFGFLRARATPASPSITPAALLTNARRSVIGSFGREKRPSLTATHVGAARISWPRVSSPDPSRAARWRSTCVRRLGTRSAAGPRRTASTR